MKKIYICEDSINSMYSAIYDAWKESRDREAGIELKGSLDTCLFCEYTETTTVPAKAAAVERLIRKHLGDEAFRNIYYALLSEDPQKADAVFHVMKGARTIKNSKRIMEHLTDPYVAKVFALSRRVSNEAHFFVEILRFRELQSGILFSEIAPENRVLTCLGDHFSDRFPLESWAIYDKNHKEVLLHRPGQHWILAVDAEPDETEIRKISDREPEFETLWRGFFQAIAIKERENPRCQRTNLPLRYREYMTEFRR